MGILISIVSVFIYFFALVHLCCEVDKLDKKLNEEIAQNRKRSDCTSDKCDR